MELRVLNVKGCAVSRGEMVWIAGASVCGCCQLGLEIQKSGRIPASTPLKVLVLVLPQQQSIISCFLVIDCYESFSYKKRALPKLDNVMFFFFKSMYSILH